MSSSRTPQDADADADDSHLHQFHFPAPPAAQSDAPATTSNPLEETVAAAAPDFECLNTPSLVMESIGTDLSLSSPEPPLTLRSGLLPVPLRQSHPSGPRLGSWRQNSATINSGRRGVSFVIPKNEVTSGDAVRPLPSAQRSGRRLSDSQTVKAASAVSPAAPASARSATPVITVSPMKPLPPADATDSPADGAAAARDDAPSLHVSVLTGSSMSDGSYVVVDGPRRRRHSSVSLSATGVEVSNPERDVVAVSPPLSHRYPTSRGVNPNRTPSRAAAAGGPLGLPPKPEHVTPRSGGRVVNANSAKPDGSGELRGSSESFLFAVPEDCGANSTTSFPDRAAAAAASLAAAGKRAGVEKASWHSADSNRGREGDNCEDREDSADALPDGDDEDRTLGTATCIGPAPYTAATKTDRGSRSIWTQVLALLERTAQQYWRNKFSMLAEIIVPLIFIVLIVVLNVAFGSEKTVAASPMDGDFPPQVDAEDYLTYMCYNDREGYAPIGDLPKCSAVAAKYVDCDGDESGLPVKGLCFLKISSKASSVVALYLEAATGQLIALPRLDSIIVHQWLAKKANLAGDSRTRTALATLSSAGLGVSSTTRYDSITYSGYLYFAPRANVPDALIAYLNATSSLFPYVYGGMFDTVAEAQNYVKNHGTNITAADSIWGIIAINNITSGFDVDIQLHANALPSPRPTVSVNYRVGYEYDGSDMFIASGYVSLQKILYDYFFTAQSGSGAISTSYSPDTTYPMIASFPTISGTHEYLISLTAPLVAFIVVLAFLYPFSQMTKRVVLEKELRIREAMLIMGLQRTSLWLCFFLVCFLELLLDCILITILLCATVVRRASPFVVFLVLLLYVCTLIPLVGLVSTFFSKARLAALMSPLLYFVMSMLIFAMNNAKEDVTLGLSVFSPTALAAVLSELLNGDSGGGFSIHDLKGSPLYSPRGYKLMLMLMGDVFIYALLMFYLDAVIPQQWGSTRHPLFFILEPYHAIKARCQRRGGDYSRYDDGGEYVIEEPQHDGTRAARDGCHLNDGAQSSTFSRLPSSSTDSQRASARFDRSVGLDPVTGATKAPSVQLKRLLKTFTRNGKKFAAVDNLSWNLYPSEISVLLGPNGSGKSTTINMMTGMLPPKSGDCFIAGHSIRHDIDAARREIGFCPQHNILWPDLTCRQHLEFFGKIKGLCGAALEDAVLDVLRAVDLAEKIDYTPKMLSGGQKRKLSVAIAFVGRNRIVLLDEPTSGMDVAARRHTWSLLRAMAPNHTILLSTHYMDEADLLGDHIAIVSDGKLQCAGGSLFLRSHAGSGYTLRFDLLPIVGSMALSYIGTRAAQLRNKWENVAQSVRRHVPEASMTVQTDAELEFCLPLSYEHKLPELLEEMERRGNRQMGIRSYALSAPTLEDVFMNIVESSRAEALAKEPPSILGASTMTASTDTTVHELSPSPPNVRHTAVNRCSPALTPAQQDVSPAARTPQPATPSAGVFARRLSRASLRFMSGDTDPSGLVRAVSFKEPDDDTLDDGERSDGGVRPTADQSVFGMRVDSPTGQSPTWRGGLPTPATPPARSDGAGGESPHDPPTRPTSPTTRRVGAAGQTCSAFADVEVPSKPGSLPSGAGSGTKGTASTTATGEPATSAATIAAAVAASSSVNSRDAALSGELAPLKSTAAQADEKLDEVWRVHPVESRRERWSLQFEGVLYKRFWCSVRDRRMLFFQIICPVLCILLAMLLQLVDSQFSGTTTLAPSTLFEQQTQMQLSQCYSLLGAVDTLDAIEPPAAKAGVQWVDGNFENTADMCSSLQDTWFVHPKPRYTAVQCNDDTIRTYLVASYPYLTGSSPLVMLYNTSSKYSLPYGVATTYQLMFHQGLLNAGRTEDEVRDSAVFATRVRPLPASSGSKKSENALASILIGVIVLIPFTFLPANPVAWVVKEREIHARHLQKLSGLPYLIYWAGNFVFDFLAYLVSMILVLVVFVIFRRWEYVGHAAIGAIIVSFVLYGLCCCTGAYAVSFLFKEHTTAQVVVMGVCFLTGFVCVILVFVLSMLQWTETASNVMRWIFRVLPPFSVGEVILNLALLEQLQLQTPSLTPWSMKMSVWADIYMAAEVPLFVLVTLLWDHPNRRAVVQRMKSCCCCGRSRANGDAANEQQQQHDSDSDSNGALITAGSDTAASGAGSGTSPGRNGYSHAPDSTPQDDRSTPASRPCVAIGSTLNDPITPVRRVSVSRGSDRACTPQQHEALRQRQQRAARAEERCLSDTLARRGTLPTAMSAAESHAVATVSDAAVIHQSQDDLPPVGRLPYGSSTSPVAPHSRRGSSPSVHSPVKLPDVLAYPPEAQKTNGSRLSSSGGAAAGVPPLAIDCLVQPQTPARGAAEEDEASGTPQTVVIVPPAAGAEKDSGARWREHVRQVRPSPSGRDRALHRQAPAAAAAASEDGAPPFAYMYAAPALEAGDYASREEEDSDVEDERLAVYQDEKTLSGLDVVRLVDLRKVYPNGKVAVRSLSFGVMPGEVFGFLGTNGAGKSTAISILTQEQLPTSGRAYVCGYDVVRDSSAAMRCIGYCPQFDACFDLLTVTEHLNFYARVRGIPAAQRDGLVRGLMDVCELVTYANVLSADLSGGNRRKLSVAVALLGAPRVVCLDEPSAGMDPIARRMLWRALDRVSKKCSIVLTTHHLEEVEALANTVAIMVDGGLRCIGDLPHLKHKYARNAYELCIRVSRHLAGNLSATRGGNAPAGENPDDAEQSEPSGHCDTVVGQEEPNYTTSPSRAGAASNRRRPRAHSITYGGTDFLDADNDVVQFMATFLPSALLVENFNDERYVYSVPATRDVAKAMAALQESMLLRRSSNGSLLGTSASRSAITPGTAAARRARTRIVRLSEVFRLLQQHQRQLNITEYSVSQVSLEQVFLRVANATDMDITPGPTAQAGAGAADQSYVSFTPSISRAKRLHGRSAHGGDAERSFMLPPSPAAMSPSLARARANSLPRVLSMRYRAASVSGGDTSAAAATASAGSAGGVGNRSALDRAYAFFRRSRARVCAAVADTEAQRERSAQQARAA